MFATLEMVFDSVNAFSFFQHKQQILRSPIPLNERQVWVCILEFLRAHMTDKWQSAAGFHFVLPLPTARVRVSRWCNSANMLYTSNARRGDSLDPRLSAVKSLIMMYISLSHSIRIDKNMQHTHEALPAYSDYYELQSSTNTSALSSRTHLNVSDTG